MDQLIQELWTALFQPAFAAGLVVGGIGMYYMVSSGRVATPPVTKLKEEVAGLKAKIAASDQRLADLKQGYEEEIKKLEDRFAVFEEWRKKRDKDALDAIGGA